MKEKDVLLIGAGSVLGGLTGGLLTDKDPKNKVPKLREASQQFFGNTLFPVVSSVQSFPQAQQWYVVVDVYRQTNIQRHEVKGIETYIKTNL